MSLEQLWLALEFSDISSFVPVASTALVLHEYALTIGLEVQQIWSREVSVATVLFIFTRYATLLDRLLVVFLGLTSSGLKACTLGTWLQAIVTSLLMVVISAIAAVRIYALWNRDWRLFAIVMIPGLFPALTNLYFRSASAVVIAPSPGLFGCQTVPTAMSALTYKNLAIAARAVSVFGDGMVVVLTWLKAYRVFVLTRGLTSRIRISTIILHDGTLYFFAICVLNVLAIMYVVSTGFNPVADVIVLPSSILMSRFLLNLRCHPARRDESPSTMPTSTETTSSHALRRLMFSSNRSGSMGGSMIGDYAGHDVTGPHWDIELVEVLNPGPPASDSGADDPLSSSAGGVATAIVPTCEIIPETRIW